MGATSHGVGDTAADALAAGDEGLAAARGRQQTIRDRPAGGRDVADADADDFDPRNVTPQKIVEGLLFVGGPGRGALTSRAMASVIRDVEPDEVERLINQLNRSYAETQAPYEIVRVDGGFRLQLCAPFRPILHRVLRRARPARLSTQALETLAIVAYRQGITGAEVDQQRRVKSHAVLAQLVLRGLLRVERDEGAGQAPRYFTTERFFQTLGIRTLDELPRLTELDDFLEAHRVA